MKMETTGKELVDLRKATYDHGFAAEKGGDPMSGFYNLWAGKYDQILANVYQGPRNLAALASEFITDKSSRILDAASGTGMVGQELKNLGYICIDALDPSQDSLDKSKELQSCNEYICDTLDEHQTKIPDNQYDAVVMCGAFGVPGHVTDACFPELIRITKPGGYIMFTFSESVINRWNSQTEAAIGALSRQGRWELVEYRWVQYLVSEALKEKAKVPVLRILPK
ncbi:uncharacterized protein LOC119727673 isoform X2 [Patiria miniata]|uniref:Methyltransferase domain-containing protein n=1 Tax=Patiria miniata TaxID=46514 RepID=A0A913ZVR5_PATMI|nr:uncharacterized protein LOC119727673 isoform X2 [Patiria miniata]XP_038055600.1 uncharacterized protein LOC119727673 isoform X2 [Patiria miniata]